MASHDFQTFKIFNKVADEIQKKAPVVAYYIKAYSLNKALEFLKMERAQGKDVSQGTTEIKQWLQDLEGLKTTLGSELGNKDQTKKVYRDYTSNLFQQSEKEFRGGIYSTRLAKDFLYTSVLFDAWELVGEVTDEIKTKKNYANEARFKIMKTLDNGIVPAQAQAEVKDDTKAQEKANTPTPQPPKGEDALSKLDFALTESVFVPKSLIDGPLEQLRQDARFNQYNALDNLLDNKSPRLQMASPFNTANAGPVSKWGFPIGQSIVIGNATNTSPVTAATPGDDTAQRRVSAPTAHRPSTAPVEYPQLQGMPGIPQSNGYYQNNVQGFQQGQNQMNFQIPRTQSPQTGINMMPQYVNNGGQAQFAPTAQMYAPQQNNQTMNMQTPGGGEFGNYNRNTNVTPAQEESWRVTIFNQNNYTEADRMRKPDSISKYQEAKDFCLQAASDIDFKKVKEAKESVLKVLKLLEQIEQSQNK